VDIEAELKDAAEALLDESLFDRYIKEKSYLIVSKFLVRKSSGNLLKSGIATNVTHVFS
jgi:hypothetical protein